MSKIPGTIRLEDAEKIKAVARNAAWILIRETNPASFQYVGKAGYTSKPFSCKPKTADNDGQHNGKTYKTAGLVVDPFAFDNNVYKSAGKEAEAKEEWAKFKESKLIDSAYKYSVNRDEHSEHYGCLTLDGNFIFGDYDLFDIVLKNQESRNLALITHKDGSIHEVVAKLTCVMHGINSAIGVNMVNHAAHFQHFDDYQDAHVFTPNGEHLFWTKEEVRAQYVAWNRKSLSESHRPADITRTGVPNWHKMPGAGIVR